MSKEVKRYCLGEFAEPHTYPIGPGAHVLARDYETLEAERDALLAERDRLREALTAMLEIHGVTQSYAETHIEIPQSWVEVSDIARAALQGAQP